MKKITLAIAMAALVIFAGCKKETETTGTTLKASIEQHKSGDSKTSLVPDGGEAEIRWTAGDQIVVNNGEDDGTFTLVGAGGSTSGTFRYNNGEYTFGDNNIAVYPETAEINGNEVTVTLPAEQTLAAPGIGVNPMLGTFTNPDNLTFTSLCGALGISLTGDDVAITAVEVVSKTDEKLNGTFTADATAIGENLKLVKSGTDGTNSVRLSCNATLTTTAQNFYFPLPVGALSEGFTLKVYIDGAAEPFTMTTTNTTTNYYAIQWNNVNQMPAVEVTAVNTVDLSTLTGNYTAQNGDALTGTLSGNYKISIADGATVTLDGVTINGVDNASYSWAGITCNGNATIILKDGTTNTVKGFYTYYPGIYVPTGHTLTIQGEGSLNARANNNSSNPGGAGIGGGYKINCGNIEIQGGTVTATGAQWAAGIGCANKCTCGNITISGGTVTATGGNIGAGIGSGYASLSICGAITISGGTVTANGNNQGAGIGSGEDAYCGNILIYGGTVTARGNGEGSGIGSGRNGHCGTVTIENTVTKVTAYRGYGYCKSIGHSSGSCGTVTIGGVVGEKSESPYVYEP